MFNQSSVQQVYKSKRCERNGCVQPQVKRIKFYHLLRVGTECNLDPNRASNLAKNHRLDCSTMLVPILVTQASG